MVAGMQEKDANGIPRMAAMLKHFDAYSREQNRGHDSYKISKKDFAETYLPQYERAFSGSNAPAGVMCSYNSENGHPSCVRARARPPLHPLIHVRAAFLDLIPRLTRHGCGAGALEDDALAPTATAVELVVA